MNEKLIFIMSFLLPGSGHLYLRKYGKFFLGLAYIAFFALAVMIVIVPSFKALSYYQTSGPDAGHYTIGITPGIDDLADNSFLILIQGVFSAFLLIALIGINLGFARTAQTSYRKIKNNEELLSFKELMRSSAGNIIPHAVSLPAYVLMFIFMIVPAITSIIIAFTNYKAPILPPAFLIQWSGLSNFKDLFVNPVYSGLFQSTIVWTIVWTLSASTLTIALGVFLAVVANNPRLKGTKFFRVIFLLPWAVPAFVTILIFQIFFSKSGTMNTIVIPFFTGNEYTISGAIPFLLDPNLAKVTIILIQGWLGFPFVFVLTTGILQAIPRDLYEASSLDGGNPWTDFWDITFPMIMISAAPMFVTQYTFNFNNVLIIYLLSGSVVKPVGATYGPLETIASLGYQMTIDQKYSTAAAIGLITSIVVSTVVLTSWIKTGAFKNEEVL